MFDFIISGYNNDKNSLCKYSFDKGIITKLKDIKLDNPSFVLSYNNLIFTYTKNPLYMVCLDDNLNILDKISLNLETMTHLAYSKKNHKLYGASYKDGSIAKIDFDESNNKFSNLLVINHKELYGDNSKCHAILYNEKEDVICTVNIGTDSLYFYSSDLDLIKIIKLRDGCGPRHAIWVKNKIYAVTEYSNELIEIDYNSGNCKYYSTLSPTFIGKSYGATLFNYQGYLYVSNRGEETIAKFKILDDGVKYINSFSCNGVHPRHMDHYENILISCNKNSDNVSIIDLNTEEEITNISFPNPSGVCILTK